jgi:transcriptional regulator with XRE-family HTH domain
MTLVSAQPVRRHVLKLRAAGGTYESIARAAGTGAMTVYRIANARRPKVRAEVAKRLLAVTEADIRGAPPAPGGTMWRLRGLIAMGHTCSRMAAEAGIPAATLRRIVRGDAATISPQLRQAVTALFDAWWDKTPPRRTRREELAAGNALQRAARNNWPCPAGLDEDQFDQPGYHPQCGWRHACGTGIAADYPFAERKAAS